MSMWRSWNFHILLDTVVNWPKHSLKVIDLSIKLSTSIFFDPAIPLLGENTTEEDAYVQENNIQ